MPVGVLTLGLFTAAGCAPLSPAAGLAVSAGPLSDQWVVRWDPQTRTPTQMVNQSLQGEAARGAPPLSDSAAEAAVRAVLHEHHDWFRLRPDDDFRVVRSYATGWLRFLRIVQTYKGVPVAGAGYDARVLPGGRVGSLEGRFYPEIEMSVIPALTADQAEASALAAMVETPSGTRPIPDLQLEYETGFRDPRILAVLPWAGEFVLAWGVVVRSPPPQSWRVYVDAVRGSVLGRQALANAWGR